MDVHPVLQGITEASQLQLPRSEPDEPIESSQLEPTRRFRARGIEVLLLPDAVDSFWVTAGLDYEGKPFKSVTQGAADLALVPLLGPKSDKATGKRGISIRGDASDESSLVRAQRPCS
jgi:hypothetical protein